MPEKKITSPLPEPVFFETVDHFRKWFVKNADKKTELMVGFYKVGTGRKSITWSESVDVALCFGWIDGVRRSMGEEAYNIRFTPRKKGSIWSAINLKKIEDLKKQGLMTEAGLKIFNERDEKKSGIYAYEKGEVKFSGEQEKLFRKNKKAWKWFSAMPPSYKIPATNWVISAKKEETRISRLQQLIDDSEAGIKIKTQRY